MTERDYLLVSALQRLRAAESLLREAHPEFIFLEMETPLRETIITIDGMIGRLEVEVEKARRRSRS